MHFFGAISEQFQIHLLVFIYEKVIYIELKYCYFIPIFYHRAQLMISFWEPSTESDSDAVIFKFRQFKTTDSAMSFKHTFEL